MSFVLTQFGKNIGEAIIEDCATNFFRGAVDKIEEKTTKSKQRNKALEGSKTEHFNEKFDILINEYCEEINKANAYYSEEELRNKFNKYYTEYLHYGQHMTDDDNYKEELFRRFKFFLEGYVKKFSKSITFGEKRILEKEDKIIGLVESVKSNILTSKDFQEISEKQSELLNKLCEDIDIPFMGVSYAYAEVCEYHSKYAFLGNVFEFDKSVDRDSSYIITLQVKNIGKTLINEMSIKNLEIFLCKEIYDDDPESGYLILKAMQHEAPEKCAINLMPNSEQKVHFVTQRREDELNGDIDSESFVDGDGWEPKFDNDRLYIEFDSNLIGKSKDKDYHFYIFLSRDNQADCEDIVGRYSVDYVGMELIDEDTK